ncbi:hypothetical protein ACP275_13G159600 [Erythranthe tilingii]
MWWRMFLDFSLIFLNIKTSSSMFERKGTRTHLISQFDTLNSKLGKIHAILIHRSDSILSVLV